MSLLSKLKSALFGESTNSSYKKQEQNKKQSSLSPKAKQFLRREVNTLSAKDINPGLKIFTPVKTPQNATTEEINKRLKNAIYYFPLPAGYKDALISLRMLIRLKRKNNTAHQENLEQLYRIACEYNFYSSSPFLEKAQEPAYNLEEVINSSDFSALTMPYNEIGYKQIPELNKTDIKWLTVEFGSPTKHISVSEYHKSFRHNAETRLIAKREKERKELWDF